MTPKSSSTAELRTVSPRTPSVSSKSFACRASAVRVLALTFPLEAFVTRDRADAVLGGAFHSLPQRRRFF